MRTPGACDEGHPGGGTVRDVSQNALRTLLGRKKRASSDARPFSLKRKLFDELNFDLDQHARRHEARDLHGGARRQIRLLLGAEEL